VAHRINIGILGCANIAQRSIIPTLAMLGEYFNLIGVASRVREKATQIANQYHTQAFLGYEALLESENLEAVYIPLPNSMHKEWVERSLERGLHVLVEKSLACTVEDAAMLNKLARDNNLVLLENFQFRFHGQLKYITDLVKSGTIGEMRLVRSSFGFPHFEDKHNIRYNKNLGGGALLDAGAYPLKLSQIFLGNDISIIAANLYFDEKFDVDTYGSAVLRQKCGDLVSQIAFGFDNHYQCNVELWGSNGKIHTNRIFTAGPEIKPMVTIETKLDTKTIELRPDDHFRNLFFYFKNLIHSVSNVGGHTDQVENEYTENVNQARLISELRTCSEE
jgi:dTDP-3,4-didehydro-2,6-dideoxy-alpha-D-glucose 3-reductase